MSCVESSLTWRSILISNQAPCKSFVCGYSRVWKSPWFCTHISNIVMLDIMVPHHCFDTVEVSNPVEWNKIAKYTMIPTALEPKYLSMNINSHEFCSQYFVQLKWLWYLCWCERKEKCHILQLLLTWHFLGQLNTKV